MLLRSTKYDRYFDVFERGEFVNINVYEDDVLIDGFLFDKDNFYTIIRRFLHANSR